MVQEAEDDEDEAAGDVALGAPALERAAALGRAASDAALPLLARLIAERRHALLQRAQGKGLDCAF